MAVPFFMRCTDENGKAFVDLTFALNISMGGILLASRHTLSRASKVSLEIPASPSWKFTFPSRPLRFFRARVVRTTHQGPYKLYVFVLPPP